MEVISRVAELRERIPARRSTSVGFVPTMGYLHRGHLRLMEIAKAQNDVVVASIFVNPTQFGANEDFSTYPRDMERDRSLLESAGVDWLFAPDSSEMYREKSQTYVDVPGIGAVLEGGIRPVYFRGVATVVTKLLNIVRPDRAYFGEKDYQQVILVRRMVEDLFLPVEIVGVPTVRDEDGVALSSRNVYLSAEERAAARRLPHALQLARDLIQSREMNSKALEAVLRSYIAEEPLAHIDVVAVRDADTLEETVELPRRSLVLLFVRFGRAQLLDHAVVESVRQPAATR